MSEDEAVKILEEFKNNKLQRDKLERNDRCGGFKMGDIYKKTELNIAIETLLQNREKDKAELERLRYIKENFDYVVQKETERKEKIIDEMAEYIAGLDIDEDICSKLNKDCDQMAYGECEDCIKQYFESLAEKCEK